MISLGLVLDLLQMAGLVGLLWVLTRPVGFSPERAWTLRVTALTVLGVATLLHLALRTHLILVSE